MKTLKKLLKVGLKAYGIWLICALLDVQNLPRLGIIIQTDRHSRVCGTCFLTQSNFGEMYLKSPNKGSLFSS